MVLFASEGFDPKDAFETGGSFAQNTENGIITRIALFPYFIATTYTFNDIDKPGPSFELPPRNTSNDELREFATHIIKCIS